MKFVVAFAVGILAGHALTDPGYTPDQSDAHLGICDPDGPRTQTIYTDGAAIAEIAVDRGVNCVRLVKRGVE